MKRTQHHNLIWSLLLDHHALQATCRERLQKAVTSWHKFDNKTLQIRSTISGMERQRSSLLLLPPGSDQMPGSSCRRGLGAAAEFSKTSLALLQHSFERLLFSSSELNWITLFWKKTYVIMRMFRIMYNCQNISLVLWRKDEIDLCISILHLLCLSLSLVNLCFADATFSLCFSFTKKTI